MISSSNASAKKDGLGRRSPFCCLRERSSPSAQEERRRRGATFRKKKGPLKDEFGIRGKGRGREETKKKKVDLSDRSEGGRPSSPRGGRGGPHR